MLYRVETFAPRAFHSELKQQTNTVKRTRQTQSTQRKFPPWACDKGCAEACAERFSALKVRTSCDCRTEPSKHGPRTSRLLGVTIHWESLIRLFCIFIPRLIQWLLCNIRRNIFTKLIEICMETPCWCPSGWCVQNGTVRLNCGTNDIG